MAIKRIVRKAEAVRKTLDVLRRKEEAGANVRAEILRVQQGAGK